MDLSSITGSAIGTRAQSVLTGNARTRCNYGGCKGAGTMEEFLNIPATQHIDVMSELMRNPELLAAMMAILAVTKKDPVLPNA